MSAAAVTSAPSATIALAFASAVANACPMAGDLLICNSKAQQWIGEPFPQEVQFVGPAGPRGGVSPQNVDALGDLVDCRVRRDGADKPPDEVVRVVKSHDPVDATLRRVHDRLEANLFQVDLSRAQPSAPLSVALRGLMRGQRPTAREHGTYGLDELAPSGPASHFRTEGQVVDRKATSSVTHPVVAAQKPRWVVEILNSVPPLRNEANDDALLLAADHPGGLLHYMADVAAVHQLRQ